ncbi:MAG TPA: hypothetical protein VIG33_17325 [Pseudobdellovibrionaceae bacterium]
MICQCERNERCHVDLMLLIAKKNLGARIGELAYAYSEFCELRQWQYPKSHGD